MSERELFEAALDLPPTDRPAFLDGHCGGDAAMRCRLAALLAKHDRAGNFLEEPVVPGVAADDPGMKSAEFPPDAAGQTLDGRYKLLDPIGEGGMGTVWMARQTEPVKRLVAVKLIKPGMDSRQVLARFDAERQALALMDHPNIAKVLDAGEIGLPRPGAPPQGGTGPDCSPPARGEGPGRGGGRPYFVMELVKGIPITKYCDEHRLAPRQVLELFLPVCHAVQHAHQKGVIHRDLKPSNVLVAEYDDHPVAKIIDFGVAKAIGSELTEATLFTQFGTVLGTLEYMSPEQAKLNALDIDTRSDIYSLGVLLYELLTGTTPLRRDRLKTAAFDEVLRLIREDEPQKPSTRLSAARIAGRGVETAPRPGFPAPRWYELDWVVMKCLEKDRNRRYATANGLATDLQRYLDNGPVAACPPSATYRLRKFVRRNRGPVLAVGVIFLLLTTGIAGTTWGLVRAERARQAEADQRALAEAALASEAEQRSRATEAARKATREAAVAAAINDFLNTDLLQLSSALEQANNGLTPDANLTLRVVLQRAAKRIEGKFAKEPDVQMKVRNTIADSLGRVGDYAGALAQYQKVAPYFHETLGPDNPETLLAELRVAGLHRLLGHKDIAVPLLERNLGKHRAALGPAHAQTHLSMNTLALAYGVYGRKEEALALAEEHLELCKRHRGPNHPVTFVAMNNVAWLYQEDDRLDKAVALFEEALAGMRKKLAPLHPERLNTTTSLARAYYLAEDIDKAVPLQESALPQYRTAYGVGDPRTLSAFNFLLSYYADAGLCDRFEALLNSTRSGGANHRTNANPGQDTREKRYRELMQRVRPAADKYRQELAAKKADHPDTLAARQAFAVSLMGQKRTTGAAYHLKAVLEARRRLLGDDHLDTQLSRFELANTRFQQRRYADAAWLLLDLAANMNRTRFEKQTKP